MTVLKFQNMQRDSCFILYMHIFKCISDRIIFKDSSHFFSRVQLCRKHSSCLRVFFFITSKWKQSKHITSSPTLSSSIATVRRQFKSHILNLYRHFLDVFFKIFAGFHFS